MIRFKIAEKLGEYRMKQAELARLTGIRPATISQYWYGTIKNINIEHLNKFCELFHCKIEDLIEYVDDVDANQPNLIEYVNIKKD